MSHHLIILIACAGIIALAFLLNSDQTEVSFMGFKLPVHCPLHKTTGINCSLCGLTRSVCMFAHGNFSESFKLHAVGPVIFIFTAIQVPFRIWSVLAYPRKSARLDKASALLFLLICAAVIINWVIYLGGFIR